MESDLIKKVAIEEWGKLYDEGCEFDLGDEFDLWSKGFKAAYNRFLHYPVDANLIDHVCKKHLKEMAYEEPKYRGQCNARCENVFHAAVKWVLSNIIAPLAPTIEQMEAKAFEKYPVRPVDWEEEHWYPSKDYNHKDREIYLQGLKDAYGQQTN